MKNSICPLYQKRHVNERRRESRIHEKVKFILNKCAYYYITSHTMAEMTSDGQPLITCSRCRCKNTAAHFKINRHGNPLKTCMGCNYRDKVKRECEHGRRRSTCKECNGIGVCCHQRQRTACNECSGGSICEHDKVRSKCVLCGGASMCEHGKERNKCSICDPVGGLAERTKQQVYRNLKAISPKPDIIEHVGCGVGQLRVHLEALFDLDMTWDNYGEWHIDHMIAIKAPNADGQPPTLEDLIPRLHWTNLQPLWAKDNLAKGNR